MSDMHVLAGGDDAIKWSVVMHLPVPNTNNDVGVNYRTALLNSGIGGSTAMTEGTGPGQITTAEKALVESGALHETIAHFELETGGTTPAELLATLREFHLIEKARVTLLVEVQLRYFGYEGNEA